MPKNNYIINKHAFICIVSTIAMYSLLSLTAKLLVSKERVILCFFIFVSAWFIFSTVYSIVGSIMLKSKKIINIKLFTFVITSVVVSAAICFSSLLYRELYMDPDLRTNPYANAYEVITLGLELLFLIFTLIDWCVSTLIFNLTKRIVDKRSIESNYNDDVSKQID